MVKNPPCNTRGMHACYIALVMSSSAQPYRLQPAWLSCCGKQGSGPLSSCVARAPHCIGLSYCRAQALGAGAPVVATDEL